MATKRCRLLGIKVVHTVVWAVLATAIVALYPAIGARSWTLFAWLHALIVPELLVLAAFRGRCPLTVIAERYTDDRRPNFDIFLPMPIAEHNKVIFSTILVGAWGWAAWLWVG